MKFLIYTFFVVLTFVAKANSFVYGIKSQEYYIKNSDNLILINQSNKVSLGVNIQTNTLEVANMLGIDKISGVVVRSIKDNSVLKILD